jgi:hypothetical protein
MILVFQRKNLKGIFVSSASLCQNQGLDTLSDNAGLINLSFSSGVVDQAIISGSGAESRCSFLFGS